MGSSLKNTFTNFDLDLIEGSAFSLITESTEYGDQTENLELAGSKTQSYQVQSMGIPVTIDHINHNIPDMKSMGIGNKGYKDQNMGITGIADHGYQTQIVGTNQGDQVQNTINELSDHKAVKCSKEESADAASSSEKPSPEAKYKALKLQYTQLTAAYAQTNLQQAIYAKEIKNASEKCIIFQQKEDEYLKEIKDKNEQFENLNTEFYSQNKQFIQYQSFVTHLKNELNKLNKNLKEEKRIVKDNQKIISSLTSSNKIAEDHLCLFGCVIESRKQPDKNIARLIKKYCKKTISGSKKSMETEGFESHSVDTGRGSSLAYSDGDGSLYSPAFTLSSFSSGATTPRNEPTKMTRNVQTSPVQWATCEISLSPIIVEEDVSLPPAVEICDIAKNTIHYEAKTNRDITTTPIETDDPIKPVAPIKTMVIAVSPIMFADKETPKAKTLNVANSPEMFHDMRTPVVITQTLNTATSTVKLDDIASLAAKTNCLNIATSHMMLDDKTAAGKTKQKREDIAKSPMYDDVKISPAKTRLLQTPDMSEPTKRTNTRIPLLTTKKLHTPNSPSTETSEPINSIISNFNSDCIEDIVVNPVPLCEHPDIKTSNASHINKITETLKEIVSKQAKQSQEDAENDREIKMILSKHRLNWTLLSPMTLSPETYQVNKPTQSETKVETKEHSCHTNKKEDQESGKCIKKASKNLAQFLFGDEDSNDEIESEDCHIKELPIESPHVVASASDNVFDLMKSTGKNNEKEDIKQKNSTSLKENIAFELPDDICNKNYAKPSNNRGTSTKYKKLTNLQKIYKANVPKSQIKSQYVTSVKKQNTKPKSHSIPPMIRSVATLSHNEEKEITLSELDAQTLLPKRQDLVEINKEKTKCSKEPPILPESSAKIDSLKTALPLTQPNSQPYSGPKKKETRSNITVSLSHAQATPSEFIQNKTSSESLALPAPAPKKSEYMPTGTRSNNTSVLHHTPKNPLPDSNTKQTNISSESSNIKYELSKVKTVPLPECGPSLPTQLINISDEAYTNPNPTVKRISRVKKGIATNPPVLPRAQTESDNTNNTSTNKSESHPSRKRPADDLVLIENVKRTCHISQLNKAKSGKSIQSIDKSVNDNKKNSSSSHEPNVGSNISKADTLRSPDVGNLKATSLTKSPNYQTRSYADYNDITMFSVPSDRKKHKFDEIRGNWSRNLLNRMVYKYASNCVTRNNSSKCDEMIVLKIKAGITKCVKSMPNQDEYAKALQQLVQELVVHSKPKIINGLMTFVNDPARKNEFITNKVQKDYLTENINTASKTEMALIDVIERVEKSGVLIWDLILEHFEFILFTLEKGSAPAFDVIDIVAHFYANICRYRSDASRIWMFMLNAMYCLSFKAIPIIKHCLDVVPEVIPYANKVLGPGLAPLIRCMVFLLNFNSCDDPLRRVNEIRWRLTNKYHYCLQDENETTLLFLLRRCIINLTENKLERDMLKLSFLILAKRRGTQWSHKNIVQKILLPMIKGEIDVSYRAKRFCITTIGFIVKPYNNDMVVHAEEVVNLLINMFNEQTKPHQIKDDIICSLLNMNMKTIANRINACLVKWNPPCVSPELEELLEIYVCSKQIKNWISIQQNYVKEI